jgi:Ca-activated chloride channel homolog
MKMKHILWMLLMIFSSSIYAQNPQKYSGVLLGKVIDKKTKKPLDYVNLTLNLNGVTIATGLSDDDGLFTFKSLKADSNYSLKLNYIGYPNSIIYQICIKQNDTLKLDLAMESGTQLHELMIVKKKSLIDKSGIHSTTIMAAPVRNINSIANTVMGVESRGGSTPNIRGARAEGSSYYIDGVRVSQGAEKYSKQSDNTFVSVKRAPLSTFSIDVDKASYSNIRRYLQSNQLPPVDAVRVEEMINYFSYDLPNTDLTHPFSIQSKVLNHPFASNKKLLHIHLQSPKIEIENSKPNMLTFLIDVSGSMSSDDKLPLLKSCLKMLVEQMHPEDKIAMVVYAGAAGLVLEPTNGKNKPKILDALDKLQSGGSTAGGAGIELAYKVAQDNFMKDGNNRIILATDGDFNVGIYDVKDLVSLIEEKRKSGVYLSTLGFGTGNINDETMENLADKGNGNYHYIDGLLEGKKVLVKELGGTLVSVANDVKIQIEFNPRFVESYKLIGYENRLLNKEDFNDDKKDAGELGAGHGVTAIYELKLNTGESEVDTDSLRYTNQVLKSGSNENEVGFIKLRYKKPGEDKSIKFEVAIENGNDNIKQTSSEIQFAYAVALFGMKLKDNKEVKKMKYADILAIAKSNKGKDEEGYRAEFIQLVETAEMLGR